jgi:hypothetical protein
MDYHPGRINCGLISQSRWSLFPTERNRPEKYRSMLAEEHLSDYLLAPGLAVVLLMEEHVTTNSSWTSHKIWTQCQSKTMSHDPHRKS